MKLYEIRRRRKYGEEKRLLIHLEVYSGFIDLSQIFFTMKENPLFIGKTLLDPQVGFLTISY